MDVAKGKIKLCLIILAIFVCSGTMNAQSSYLTRKVSISIPSCTIEIALREIGKSADFCFSYDADLIPGNRKVNVKAFNTPVNLLLKEILGKGIIPREVGNHVILVRSRTAAREKKEFPDVIVSGTILDATDHLPLKDATVYEVDNKKAAITGDKGTYKLIIPSGKKIRGLAFCNRLCRHRRLHQTV